MLVPNILRIVSFVLFLSWFVFRPRRIPNEDVFVYNATVILYALSSLVRIKWLYKFPKIVAIYIGYAFFPLICRVLMLIIWSSYDMSFSFFFQVLCSLIVYSFFPLAIIGEYNVFNSVNMMDKE